MASENLNMQGLSHILTIKYMTDPLKTLLNTSSTLTSAQLKESAATVDAISQMILSSNATSSSSEVSTNEQDNAIQSIIKDVCFPLFYSLHLLPDSSKIKSDRRKVLSSIIQCINVALNNVCDEPLACQIILQTLVPLGLLSNQTGLLLLRFKDPEYHCCFQEGKLDGSILLELFQICFNKPSTAIEKVFSHLSNYETNKEEFLKVLSEALLSTLETKSLFSKAISIIVKLISICPQNLQDRIMNEVWLRFTKPLPICADGSLDKDCLWQSLFVFFCFKDWFFPLDKGEEAKDILASHLEDRFWLIVQSGMLSIEPSHRKMSMYLLKRLVDTCHQNKCIINISKNDGIGSSPVFWWDSEKSSALFTIWEDFTIVMEVLEEKQVHVIKPVLPRVRSLISACSKQNKDMKEVQPMMHTSWLVAFLSRCFHHESYFMSRWGALTLLKLDIKQIPFVQQGQLNFLSSDLVTYLQENKLYSRYEGAQQERCSPVRDALVDFFANIFQCFTQEEKVQYFTNILQKVSDNTWGSIPMLFMFEGLSRIPPQPVISSQILDQVRYVIQACLTTHEVSTRGAIQCFICQTIMNLIDMEQVSLSQFFTVVAELNREESFQRGTALWNLMVDWLNSDVVQKKWTDELVIINAMAYLKQDNWKNTEAAIMFDGNEVVSIARMLLLFADMTASRNSSFEVENGHRNLETCPLGKVLSESSLLFSNIGTRSYINTKHVDASLALLCCFVKELGFSDHTSMSRQDKVRGLIKLMIGANVGSVFTYILKRIVQDLKKPDDLDEIKFYADFVSVSGGISDKTQVPLQDLLKFVGKIFSANIKAKQDDEVNADLEVLTLSAVTIFNAIFKVVLASENNEAQEVIFGKILELPPIHDILMPFTKRKSGSRVSNLQMGRVISHFVSNFWQCKKGIFLVERKLGRPYSHLDGILDDAMDAFSIGSGDSDIAVLQAMELIMQELVSHKLASDIPQFLKMAWGKMMEERKNALFWLRLETLIPVALHPSLLKQDGQSEIANYIQEFLTDLMELAEVKTGVSYLLTQQLTSVMMEHDKDRSIGKSLVDYLIDASIFGPIYDKGKKLLQDVFAYIDNMGDQCATNQITSSTSKNDMNTRIIMINWLSSLKPSVPDDRDFAMKFLRSLRDKYLHMASLTTYKQFSNSYHHRLKHRMLLVFLLLSDFIQEDACKEFLDALWQALILECHPSVRHSLEWLVMRLIVKYPTFVSSIWEIFLMFTEKRSMCVCSLFLIMSRIGMKLPKEMQSDFYSQAFSHALSWSLAHHYNTRIFAQACLMCLWQQCNELDLTQVLQTFHVVQSTADFVLKNRNSSGTVMKLMENFMFSSLDPVNDYSAETIFHTLPRLAAITDDEWIFPEQLVKQDPSWKTTNCKAISFLNSSSDLGKCEEGPWRIKAQVVNDDEIVETTDGDFQKKIVSWRQMSPDQETEAELITQRTRLKNGGLILVTSLIDKIPNLGGLCRTSEIFGVSEFVMGNLTHIDDHMFQSLSVSAQKWLNITEVNRYQVSTYLEEKRAQGYTLVGVEQTANSVPLDKYRFPKNTLLLLGNEKEGIPPDMIQNLDVCVEIPQQGVIRSLNVHVCGALIVWEYTRQFLAEECD